MWARVASLALGLWLMAAPGVLDYGGAGRVNDLVVGPIAAAAAAIAISGVTRGIRWVNVLLGAWLVLSAGIFSRTPPARWSTAAIGLAMLALGLVKGTVRQRYGGGWRALIDEPAPPNLCSGGQPGNAASSDG
ncbi:MAG TPA: hypothetical protein VFK09_06645 [Gemmatimonadales bacterium]|jgi:hypothetical protein|nr:hypothetical protein [Gemmatimonadales bacterium]